MTITNRFVQVVLLITFLSVSSWAQITQLRGELRGKEGEPVTGIMLTLRRVDVGGINEYEIETDNRGNFTRLGIAAGEYSISFTVGDKQYQTRTRLSPGDTDVELDIQTLEYQAYEYDPVTGSVDRVVRDIRELSSSVRIIAAPRNDEERKARAEAAEKDGAMREAFSAGLEAMKVDDFAEAIAQFSSAAAGNSTQHLIYANLALAYEKSEMWAEAVASYEEAQSIAEFADVPPEESNYFFALSLSYAHLGNADQALSNAESLVLMDPENASRSFMNIGNSLTNRGDTEGAVRAFNRVLEIDPDTVEAYYQLAITMFYSNETIPDAIPLLEEYLSRAPDGPNADAAQQFLDVARESQ